MALIELMREELPYEINEELKLFRTNIQFCGDDKQVILITGAFSGEGKSTVAMDLACAMAEIDKKVLLLDVDMRKSQLRKKVKGQPPKKGLSHYLSGQTDLGEVIFKTTVPNFTVIFSGTAPPNPTELISSPRFPALIRAAREHYDYVILDCSPVGMVVDAAVAAQHCDGIVLVLEAGEVKYRMAQEVVQRLGMTGTPILGVVLNKVDRRNRGGYYRRYYGKRSYRYYRIYK